MSSAGLEAQRLLDEAAALAAGAVAPVGLATGGWSGMLESGAGVAGQVAAGVAGGGGGWESVWSWVSPIAGLISGLFGGGDEATAAPAKYVWPEAQSVAAGFAGSAAERIHGVDYEAGGTVRAVNAPSVVVQVQALDTASFLERTPEIAQAVRRSLLESDALSGVLSEM